MASASSSKWRLLLVAAFVALVLAPVGLSIASCFTPPVGLEKGRLRPCPESPNCVSSEAGEPEGAAIEPLRFEGDPEAAFASLVAFLREEPRVELVTVEPDYAHAVFRTALLRFRDDVELRLDVEARVVHVRSASRVGYSDLGANRARIESIRERWPR